MANGSDWRNLQQTHTNARTKVNQNYGEGAKDKKFQNLQSSILGNDDAERAAYNTEVEKNLYAGNAGWSSQGNLAKPNNKKGKINTYKQKQNQLAS